MPRSFPGPSTNTTVYGLVGKRFAYWSISQETAMQMALNLGLNEQQVVSIGVLRSRNYESQIASVLRREGAGDRPLVCLGASVSGLELHHGRLMVGTHDSGEHMVGAPHMLGAILHEMPNGHFVDLVVNGRHCFHLAKASDGKVTMVSNCLHFMGRIAVFEGSDAISTMHSLVLEVIEVGGI